MIYDSYVEYEYQKELQDEQERLAKLSDPKRTLKRLLPDKTIDDNREFEDRFLRAARTLERMVVQNIYSDIALGKDLDCSIRGSAESGDIKITNILSSTFLPTN